jgi:SEC-C motif domain protein
MRSRYTAFALSERDYLLASWHPDYRPPQLQLDADIRWVGLEILATEQQGNGATVEFEASLMSQGEVSAMRECSQFLRLDGCWFYTTGEQLAPRLQPWKPGRNQDCPCGSGLKYKRCCGKA